MADYRFYLDRVLTKKKSVVGEYLQRVYSTPYSVIGAGILNFDIDGNPPIDLFDEIGNINPTNYDYDIAKDYMTNEIDNLSPDTIISNDYRYGVKLRKDGGLHYVVKWFDIFNFNDLIQGNNSLQRTYTENGTIHLPNDSTVYLLNNDYRFDLQEDIAIKIKYANTGLAGRIITNSTNNLQILAQGNGQIRVFSGGNLVIISSINLIQNEEAELILEVKDYDNDNFSLQLSFLNYTNPLVIRDKSEILPSTASIVFGATGETGSNTNRGKLNSLKIERL